MPQLHYLTRIQPLKYSIPINKYTLQRTITRLNFPQQTAWSFNPTHIPYIAIFISVWRPSLHLLRHDTLVSHTRQPIRSQAPCSHHTKDVHTRPGTHQQTPTYSQ